MERITTKFAKVARMSGGWFLMALLALMPAACAPVKEGGERQKEGVVVLDIGHFIGGEGAVSPGAVNGQVLRECEFWHRYAWVVRDVVKRAGYECVVINRGNPPKEEKMKEEAARAGVIYLRHPDIGGLRYPSRYYPDRVAAGMVSADYAIYRRAACAVFLHLNSSGNRWVHGASPSVILYNRYNGGTLASCLRESLERDVLNKGMPNGGRGCGGEMRCTDAERAAGWLNACDDAGIPAAVVEAAFVNNRGHAEFLTRDAGARAFASAIGRAIVRFLKMPPDARHYRSNPNVPDQGSFGYAKESRCLNVPGARRLFP